MTEYTGEFNIFRQEGENEVELKCLIKVILLWLYI